MTRADQKILFTALAFLAVLLKDEEIEAKDEASRVRHLAELIESFCAETLGAAPASAGDMDAESCAHFINQLVSDNRQNRVLLDDAAEILETAMQQDGFDFSTEQAAERALDNIRRVVAA